MPKLIIVGADTDSVYKASVIHENTPFACAKSSMEFTITLTFVSSDDFSKILEMGETKGNMFISNILFKRNLEIEI